jgi:ABC-2 type transport system permease protein
MPTVTGLQYDSTGPFKIQPLLMSDERNAWRKMGELSPDSLQVNFRPEDGDEKAKYPTMLALTRKMSNGKEQHIIISADADFMSGAELSRYNPESANFYLNTALFGWLSNGEFPVDVSRPDSKDHYIRLTGDDVPIQRIIYVWIMPFILFIMGMVLLVRRKKQ